MDEADIAINRTRNMSYDTTGIGYSPDSSYFYDDILHELGHGHGLGHINDTLSLMYWNTAAFRPFITTSGPSWPGPATLLGAMDMIYTSTANSPASLGCGSFKILAPNKRFCIDPTLGISIIPDSPYNLALFPNPVNISDINIAYRLTNNSQVQFKIADCTGRVIMILKDKGESPGTYDERINVDSLAGGVYLFLAYIDGELQVIKFIKL